MKRKLTQYTCNRCGNVWTPRKPNPRVCANCRSPYWDSKRKNLIKPEDMAKPKNKKELTLEERIANLHK